MITRIIACSMLMGLAIALIGCDRVAPARKNKEVKLEPVAVVEAKKDPPKKEEVDPKLPPKKKESQLSRQRDLISYRPYFAELGRAYQLILTTNDKAPQSKEDFRTLLGKDMMKLIDDGYVAFIYNVKPQQMPKGASNTIVAYEVYFDAAGLRLVLMGDGSVQEMNVDVYAKTPKANDK